MAVVFHAVFNHLFIAFGGLLEALQAAVAYAHAAKLVVFLLNVLLLLGRGMCAFEVLQPLFCLSQGHKGFAAGSFDGDEICSPHFSAGCAVGIMEGRIGLGCAEYAGHFGQQVRGGTFLPHLPAEGFSLRLCKSGEAGSKEENEGKDFLHKGCGIRI